MKTWLITGTSSGLGRVLTEQLLARGDRVAATLRRAERLDHLAARYPDTLYVYELDVTDTTTIRRVVDQAFEQLGAIDVVVSNAGYALFGAGEEVTDAQIQAQIDTNILGSVQLIRAALPRLRAQRAGHIVQVSSEGGLIAFPNFSLYHLSKWAIEGFVESVSQEVAPFGVTFTLVEPGPTATDFGANLDRPKPMPEYEDTPAGDVRRALAAGTFGSVSDPGKIVKQMIATVETEKPPYRLVLGAGAYQRLHHALSNRLAALEAQKGEAFSTEAES